MDSEEPSSSFQPMEEEKNETIDNKSENKDNETFYITLDEVESGEESYSENEEDIEMVAEENGYDIILSNEENDFEDLDYELTLPKKNSLTTEVFPGAILGHTSTMTIFKFVYDGRDEIGFFKSSMVFIDEKRVPKKSLKNISEFFKQYDDKVSVSVLILQSRLADTSTKNLSLVTEGGETYYPKYYSHVVWVGPNPPNEKIMKYSRKKIEEYKVVRDAKGKIIYYNLSSLVGFIAFQEGTAQFKLTQLHIKRKPVKNVVAFFRDFFDLNNEVTFDAEYSSVYPAHILDASNFGGMEHETTFKPTWKVTLLWTDEERPEFAYVPELVHPISSAQIQKNQDRNNYKAVLRSSEYFAGKLEKFIDESKGIISLLDKKIIFDRSVLSIYGHEADASIPISDQLNIGDNLFGFNQPITESDQVLFKDITHKAVQLWKGKRKAIQNFVPEISSTKIINYKVNFPPYWQATIFNEVGIIIENDGLQGIVEISERGDRALIWRNRCFYNGDRLTQRMDMNNHFKVGTEVRLNLIQPSTNYNDFKYLAVVSWIGGYPDEEALKTRDTDVTEYSSAKIIKLEEPTPNIGITSGILSISGVSSLSGSKVLFYRSNFYMFGVCLFKSDLAYVLSENDKVQVALRPATPEEVSDALNRFNTKIKYAANIVWVGFAPKIEEDCSNTEFPNCPNIYPFLKKRSISEEFFKKIIAGNCPPKTIPSSPAVIKQKSPLPPDSTYAYISELTRPNPNTPTRNGIMTISTGPHKNQKAFICLNNVYIYGISMAKADFMFFYRRENYKIQLSDASTGNNIVPFSINKAWIGNSPTNKINVESITEKDISKNSALNDWIRSHQMTLSSFIKCCKGLSTPLPFFPVPGVQLVSKVTYLYPPPNPNEPIKYGILKIFTPGKFEGKDVLFDREDLYVYNSHFKRGSLASVLRIGDKVMCEPQEIIGKNKKRWKTNLNKEKIPKYAACLAWLCGNRPSSSKVTDISNKNLNLVQWLNKRKLTIGTFRKILNGTCITPLMISNETQFNDIDARSDIRSRLGPKSVLPDRPKQEPLRTSQLRDPLSPSNPYEQPLRSFTQDEFESTRHSLFSRNESVRSYMTSHQEPIVAPPPPCITRDDLVSTNSILIEAQTLIKKVMTFRTPDDPGCLDLIKSDSELNVATFICKTLSNAVNYCKNGRLSSPQFIEQQRASSPSRIVSLPPIGSRSQPTDQYHLNNFSQPSAWEGVHPSRGLTGLSKPLLDYSASSFEGYGMREDSQEPPYKRKLNNEWNGYY